MEPAKHAATSVKDLLKKDHSISAPIGMRRSFLVYLELSTNLLIDFRFRKIDVR